MSYTSLDSRLLGPEALKFKEGMERMIVGQKPAVNALVRAYQHYLAGMRDPTKPIASLMFAGPTGTGKTRVIEAAATALYGSVKRFMKIDCAEYQHSQQTAKLVGAPPGFLGHRKTTPLLLQSFLDSHHASENGPMFLLFDEFEKGSPALYQLLLGVLDKGVLTLGDNTQTCFGGCIIVFTSNLGARQIQQFLGYQVGFGRSHSGNLTKNDSAKLRRISQYAITRFFSPEFVNRLDDLVVFEPLNSEQLREILLRELVRIQDRINSGRGAKFTFECSPDVLELLLREGTDRISGARQILRSLERYLLMPLAAIASNNQVLNGDQVRVELDPATGKPCFVKAAFSAYYSSG